MFHENPSESDPIRSLMDDLIWIADVTDFNPEWLQSHPERVYASIRAGLESQQHYAPTIRGIIELIVLVVTDDSWKVWFDPIAELIVAHLNDTNNLFEISFREAIGEFRGLVGFYGRLDKVRPVQVDALLQAYIRLIKAMIYRHGLELPETLINQSVRTAQTLDDHIESSRLYQTLALYFVHYGDQETAEAYAKLASSEYEFIEDSTGVLEAGLTMTALYRRSLRFRRAEYFVNRIIDMHTPAQPDLRYATLCYEFAATCYAHDQFELAFNYYQHALAIFETLDAPYHIAMTWQALSQVYTQYGDFPKAESLIRDTRKRWELLGNQYEWVNTFFGEAYLELKRGNRNLGLKQLRETIDLAYKTLDNTPAREALIVSLQEHVERYSAVVVR